MRAIIILSLLLVSLFLAVPLHAQEEVQRLEQLVVDIWPDYDRASVLVLLTGRLPESTTLPAAIAVPVPEGATIHAVASVSSANEMFESPYTLEEGLLRFTTPEERFRVEYYLPYEANGLARSFAFDWQSAMEIADLNVSIQQPQAASSMATVPEAEVVGQGNDGLRYHDFTVQPLAANQPYRIEVDYTLNGEQLTAPPSAATAPAAQDQEEDAPIDGRTMNWPLFLGGAGILIILLALVWQVWGRRGPSAQPPRKPAVRREATAPRRSAARPVSPARFCHNCGAEAQSEDRFCRTCGTELKR